MRVGVGISPIPKKGRAELPKGGFMPTRKARSVRSHESRQSDTGSRTRHTRRKRAITEHAMQFVRNIRDRTGSGDAEWKIMLPAKWRAYMRRLMPITPTGHAITTQWVHTSQVDRRLSTVQGAEDVSGGDEFIRPHTGDLEVDQAIEWFVTRAGSGVMERSVRMRIQRVRDWLDYLFEERHVTQERVHDEYITAVLPLVFRDIWTEHRELIMNIANVDDVNQNVFVMAPRRAGKTQAVSAFLAMCLLEIPYIDVAIASRIVHQAAAVINIMKRFLGKIPWIEDVKINWSQRTVVIGSVAVPTDLRRVHALSGLNPEVRTRVSFYLHHAHTKVGPVQAQGRSNSSSRSAQFKSKGDAQCKGWVIALQEAPWSRTSSQLDSPTFCAMCFAS